MIESFSFPKEFAALRYNGKAQCAKYTVLDSRDRCSHPGQNGLDLMLEMV